MAIVREGLDPEEWAVYLFNEKYVPLKNIIVATKGYGELEGRRVETSNLQHFFDELAPKAHHRIEPMMPELFAINNEFVLTFYIDDLIYDRKYVFVPGSVSDENLINIPAIGKPGILIR